MTRSEQPVDVFTWAECEFHVRTIVDQDDGQPTAYEFHRIWIDTYGNAGQLRTTTPPDVGDLIWLRDVSSRSTSREEGCYRVVEREWSYPQYRSRAWNNHGIDQGPTCIVFLELAESSFALEVEEADVEEVNA